MMWCGNEAGPVGICLTIEKSAFESTLSWLLRSSAV